MLDWMCAHWIPLLDLLGLGLATIGAFVAAWDAVKPFQGDRFESGIGSGPIGGVPTNDAPIETKAWKAFEQSRLQQIRNGLWLLGIGTLLQVIAAAPSFFDK